MHVNPQNHGGDSTPLQLNTSSSPLSGANQMSNNISRLAQLDSLRGLAAVFVLFHHICVSCWPFPDVAIPIAYAWCLSWLRYGHLAVTFFIVLSGFVIALPLVQRAQLSEWSDQVRWGSFFRRRALRILPPYYAALGFSILLMACMHGWKALTASDVMGHLFLLHDWGIGNNFAINGPMWSIPIEWHIYFTVPLIYLFWKRVGAIATTVLWLIGAVCAAHLIHSPQLRDTIAPFYYGLFAMGGAAAFIVTKHKDKWMRVATGILPFIACSVLWAFVMFMTPWRWFIYHEGRYDLMFGVVATMLIIWVTACQSPLQRLLKATPLVRLGEMSYSLYLIHAPLLAYFDDKLSALDIQGGLKFLLLCVIAAPIIICLTYGFHCIFERPFLVSKTWKSKPACPEVVARSQT